MIPALILYAVIAVMIPVARCQHRRIETWYRAAVVRREILQAVEALGAAILALTVMGESMRQARHAFDSLKEATR